MHIHFRDPSLLAAKYFGIKNSRQNRNKEKRRYGQGYGDSGVEWNENEPTVLFIRVLVEIRQELMLQDSTKSSSGRFMTIRPQSG